MKRALEKCGFGNIREVKPGETSLKNLELLFYKAEAGNENISFHIEAMKIAEPIIQKNIRNLPKNFIKKLLAYFFNISISAFNKRRAVFPNRKWFLEKYLIIKQLFN
jgi:hypothetical protein